MTAQPSPLLAQLAVQKLLATVMNNAGATQSRDALVALVLTDPQTGHPLASPARARRFATMGAAVDAWQDAVATTEGLASVPARQLPVASLHVADSASDLLDPDPLMRIFLADAVAA